MNYPSLNLSIRCRLDWLGSHVEIVHLIKKAIATSIGSTKLIPPISFL